MKRRPGTRPDLAEKNKTHGLSKEPGYRSWKDMRARCLNPSNSEYKNYGGRGIGICERWSDFANFHADMGPRPNGLTLERINVNGNYGPDNCTWATRAEQMCNQRRNVKITIDGETKTLEHWARQRGILGSTASYRYRQGKPLEEVLSTRDLRR